MTNKKRSNQLWNIYHHQNLQDFDTMRESVQSFMDLVVENNASFRVSTYYKTQLFVEVVKEYDNHSFARIDGKGQIYKAKPIKGRDITIDDYIHNGQWDKVTEAEYFE